MFGKKSLFQGRLIKIIQLTVAILAFLGRSLGQPDNGKNINTDRCLCLEEIADKLRLPVSLANANDGSNRIFVAEQYGAVNILFPNGTKLNEPLIDISERIGKLAKVSEEGIGDIAFHPDFASNGLFYMLFSTPEKKDAADHYSNLAEFRISANDVNKADPDYFRLLLKIPEAGWKHNAEKLLFGIDNYLYIFTGDGGGKPDALNNEAQAMDKYNGKVLRIDVGPHTGADPYWIPDDNPFQEPLADGTKPLPEIYALGFRNPWRCGMDSGDRLTGYGRGRMFCGEVGQSSVEEINHIKKGGNYGWNVLEGDGLQCENCKLAPIGEKNMVQPIFSYTHETKIGKAVIGGQFYRGCLYPQLNGLYIWGDHYAGLLHRLYETATGEWGHSEIELCDKSVCKAPLTDDFASKIISFGQDENGEVYMLAVNNANPAKKAGFVYRFVDPLVQKDPALCEAEFQERVDAMKTSSSEQNNPDSLFETFPGNKKEKLAPNASKPGAQPPSPSIDGVAEKKIKISQSVINLSPAGLSNKEQYFSYLQNLKKLSKQGGNLQIKQEEANEQPDTGDSAQNQIKDSAQTKNTDSEQTQVTDLAQTQNTDLAQTHTDETTGSNLEELADNLMNDPFFASVVDNFLELTQQNELDISNGEGPSDDAIDKLIDEMFSDPAAMDGAISGLLATFNLDQLATFDKTSSSNNDDIEPSDKESAQGIEEGEAGVLQLLARHFPKIDVGTVFQDLPSITNEEEILSTATNTDTTLDIVDESEGGTDGAEEEQLTSEDIYEALINDFLKDPNMETLAEILYDQPIIQTMLINLADGSETGRNLETFLMNGPDAAKILALLIKKPEANTLIRNILMEPGAFDSIKEQLYVLMEAESDGEEEETLDDKTETSSKTEHKEDDIDTFISFLLQETTPLTRILQILSREDPLGLVSELLVNKRSSDAMKDLLGYPFGEDLINVLLGGLTPEEWLIELEDNPHLEILLEYLLQSDPSKNLIKPILSNVFREGISKLVYPSESNSAENPVNVNDDTDIANIVSLIENNANYMQLVDAILKKSNVAQVVVALMNDEKVGKMMLNFLESKYPRRRLGSYLVKNIGYILQSPKGTKLFDYLLRSPYMGPNTVSLIKSMYTEKLAADSTSELTEDTSSANDLQDYFLTVLKKVANLISDSHAKNLIVDLTRIQALAEKKRKAIVRKLKVPAQEAPSSPDDEPTPIVPGSQSAAAPRFISFKTPRTFEHVFRWHRARGKAQLFSK